MNRHLMADVAQWMPEKVVPRLYLWYKRYHNIQILRSRDSKTNWISVNRNSPDSRMAIGIVRVIRWRTTK